MEDKTHLESGRSSNHRPPGYGITGRDDTPPSYESLFGKLKKAKQDSHGPVEFTQNACRLGCTVICGSVVGLIILGICTGIPIAMIVIGSLHLHDCPVERYIPIYLVVGGSFGLFCCLVSLYNRAKTRKEGDDKDSDTPTPCLSRILSLVSCFMTAWFIAGNVWVYRKYNDWSPDPLSPNYCHQTLYLFAFWQITVSYIVSGALMVLVCCCSCLLVCRKDSE